MPKKNALPKEEEAQEEVLEESPVEEQEVDPLVGQPDDTPEKREYRAMLAMYKLQNPVKYERKKEEFVKKLGGMISMEVRSNPKGLIRKTFQVPNIASKKVRK